MGLKWRLYIDWHLLCYVLYYIYYSLLLTLLIKPGMVVILGLICYFIKAVYKNVSNGNFGRQNHNSKKTNFSRLVNKNDSSLY